MLKVEPLNSKDHDRKGFDCGTESLNDFIKTKARANSENGLCGVHVLVDDESERSAGGKLPIKGYFAITPYTVDEEARKHEAFRAFAFHHALPCYLLGRFAVDLKHQGDGETASTLFVEALYLIHACFQNCGGIGMMIHARLDARALAFYQKWECVDCGEFDSRRYLFLPRKKIEAFLRAAEMPLSDSTILHAPLAPVEPPVGSPSLAVRVKRLFTAIFK